MKPILTRRYRRRSTPARTEETFFKKDTQEMFFGDPSPDGFFQPAVTGAPAQNIPRKPQDPEKEDKRIRRQPDKKEDEKKEPDYSVLKKDTSVTAPSPRRVSNCSGKLSGKGKPLPAVANDFFSSRMGYDFSGVKVHTDTDAAESAKGIRANAYTLGNNIVFNEGQYDLESGEGRKLLAHELTHVIQQGKGLSKKIQREVEDGDPLTPTEDELITISAVVGSEAWPGQERDIAWVYYNLIIKKNDVAKGLKES